MMKLFSSSSPFDGDVEKITDEKNTSEDWGMILDFCDRVKVAPNGPKDCLRSIMKRLYHQVPHVVLQSLTLLDACVNNCGKPFQTIIASREFETDFRKLLSKSHPKLQEKLKQMLQKWAEVDFKEDSQLSLIPSLYANLKKEGVDFTPQSEPARKNHVKETSRQKEDEDIAKAIQLSLQESKISPSLQPKSTASSQSNSSQLYPSAEGTAGAMKKEEKKARALYDFEAVEDNELTFKTGEIVIIIDDSDVNWWKGSNHRGEGLFPANFVTTNLEVDSEAGKQKDKRRRRSVQFNEEVEVKTVNAEGEPPADPTNVEISEEQIDRVMAMLNDADPTSPETDPIELSRLEQEVDLMSPLIDAELEKIDRRHAQLTGISTELVDALNLYHQLMHEMPTSVSNVYGTSTGAPVGISSPNYPMYPTAMYAPNLQTPHAGQVSGQFYEPQFPHATASHPGPQHLFDVQQSGSGQQQAQVTQSLMSTPYAYPNSPQHPQQHFVPMNGDNPPIDGMAVSYGEQQHMQYSTSSMQQPQFFPGNAPIPASASPAMQLATDQIGQQSQQFSSPIHLQSHQPFPVYSNGPPPDGTVPGYVPSQVPPMN